MTVTKTVKDLPQGSEPYVENGRLDDGEAIITLHEATASDSGDWVDAIIEGGELATIHEELAKSISESAKAHRKWSKAEERYGGKLRALRSKYEDELSVTNRLFTAATRGLA